MRFYIFILVVISAVLGATFNKYDSDLRECYQKDNLKVNTCLTEYFANIKPALSDQTFYSSDKDKPARNSSLSRVDVKRIVIKEKGFILQGKLVFDNVTLQGLNSYEVANVTIDPSRGVIVVNLMVNELNFIGQYEADGILMLIDFRGSGFFEANLINTQTELTFTTTLGDEGFRLNKTKISLTPKKLSAHLEGIFGGDEVGKAVNQLLDTNGLFLFAELKTPVEEAFAGPINEIFRDSVENFPTELFLKVLK